MFMASDMNPFSFPAERCALVSPHLADASLPFTGVGILQTFYFLEVVKGILSQCEECQYAVLGHVLAANSLSFSAGFLGTVSIKLKPCRLPILTASSKQMNACCSLGSLPNGWNQS